MVAPVPRALVLGGGGLAGIAWELGAIAALARADVHVVTGAAGADLVVGASAGSLVGAALLGGGDLQ